MTDPNTASPSPVAPAAPEPAPAAAPAVKSGLKSTELYLAALALGALIWCLQEVVRMLPTIAATPGMPAWAAPLLGLVPVGVGFVMKLLVSEYASLRTQLKLGTDPAQAAGADAAAQPGSNLSA